MRDVAEAVLQMLASGQRGALATVVRASGSTPQQPGARLARMPDGRLVGTVGGGAIEQAVVEALEDVLRTGQSQVLVRDLGHDLGMCCGGRMEVFVEPIEAIPRLVLFGAGHIAVPAAALARSVGFAVHVVDDREELVTHERFPGCELTPRDASSVLKLMRLGERDYVLIVTHDHRLDEELLALALQQSPAYIGLVGSKRKVFRLLQRISARRGPQDVSRVFAPVGLDLGAQTPAEIAVSIVAELIALRNGKSVPHMRAVEDARLLRLLESPEDATEDSETDDASSGRDSLMPAAATTPRAVALPPAAVSDTSSSRRPTAKLGLDALAERVHRDLSLLNYPQRDWLTPRKTAGGSPIYDALIVGAGQSGLACAFGLMRERVKNLLIVDQNPLDRAGPWLNFARMKTLRTPKYLTGPDLGIPNLTPRAWYEAQHGDGSWETLGLIPKETWAEYLAWYRETLSIPVQPDTAVGALTWDQGERAFRVPCTGNSGAPTLWARRVVLATGIDGSGAWQVPRMISENLPKSLYAHTRWDIDFEALRGKRIAVLGAGASAFDNASTALDYGANTVHMFFRRPSLVNVNSYRWAEFVGFLRHMGDLPDPDKWRFISQILRMGQLPPTDTYKRATAHAGFEIKPGTGWTTVAAKGDAVLIGTKAGTLEYDFVIVGTGFVTDLSTRPELKAFEAAIARWSDRYTPPPEDHNDELSRHPYLGEHFEFTERTRGEAPYLKYLYNYTFGGLLSLGFGGASISGMKYSVPRLVSGITGSYFIEDRNHYFDTLCNFAEREF